YAQRSLGLPIRSKPDPFRRAVAALVDLAIATGIGVLAGLFVDSVVGIGASVLNSQADLSAVGVLFGIAAGTVYYLCRDAIRLKFRRSIGKALFDLRPLMADSADPGAVTVRASI